MPGYKNGGLRGGELHLEGAQDLLLAGVGTMKPDDLLLPNGVMLQTESGKSGSCTFGVFCLNVSLCCAKCRA